MTSSVVKEATTEPALMEGVERTNAVVVRGSGQGTGVSCHIQVHLSGNNVPTVKTTSEPYKPAFHGGHLSRNMSYGSAATLQIFRLP